MTARSRTDSVEQIPGPVLRLTTEQARSYRTGGLGRSALDRPALVFLPLGMAMGPRGLNLLPESLLSFLDPAVSAALAAAGALAGLGLYRDRRREPALVGSVVADSGLTIAAVSVCAAAIWRATGLPAEATLVASVCLGIAAIASSPGIRNATHPFAPLVGRVSGLGAAIAIVLGALALAWLPRQSPAGTLWNVGELCAIAAMIGFAGWLLAGQTSDDNEQRVFAAGTVLLLGGAADYLAASALFMGLAAGACWRAAGGAATDRLTRDLEYLQHPLVVLLLLIAGAKCHVSIGAIALVAAYALCRTAAKLASGLVISRLAASGRPLALGLYLLPPGVVGVAFGLNIAAVWSDPAAALLLDVLVLGTLLAELLAVANAPREAA
jgi:hypothetical protein